MSVETSERDDLGAVGLIGFLTAIVASRLRHQAVGGRHLGECRRGMWVDGYSGGDGAPCSQACVIARLGLVLGLAYLAREAQP